MVEVELSKLTKRFSGVVAPAVDAVDLAIVAGERFAIVGPSGSGKTTLLRMIAGLDAPTSGAVAIGGRVVNDVAPRDRGVAMVFQHPALYPHKSVRDNLGAGLAARGVAATEIAEQVATIAGWLGLTSFLDRKPRALSGGERQRVALGRAVVTKPRVLLLDEPFTGLDAPLRNSLRAAMLDLHRRAGWTAILVTHDQNEALAVGNRVAVMRGGKIEQVGTPAELYHHPANRFVAGFLGDPPMSFLFDEPTKRWLGVRPDAVELTPGEGDRRVEAVVQRVEPRGHESIVWLDVAGRSIAARAASFAGAPGDSITIGLDMSKACWFDRDDNGKGD